MPMYDRICYGCKAEKIDCLERIVDNAPEPCECGGELVRGYVVGQRVAAVIGDDIPGGLMIKHGICNDDGTPRRYDTKSSIRQAAAAKGLTWGVTSHIGLRGSDKSPHSRKWD